MALQFTYNPMLLTHRDWVRFLVGDTQAMSPELDDLEIEGLLADTEIPDPVTITADDTRGYRYQVAAKAADIIAAKHVRDVDRSLDGQSISISIRARAYTALAKRLREQARAIEGGVVRTERW